MGILDPVEGVTLEQWADVNAKIASGSSADEAIKLINADMPKWDRVNAEWTTRMSNDSSFTISTKYAEAFNKTASGNMGVGSEVNENTCSFEKWVESMAAQDVLGKRGRDAQDILKDFGMTVADFSNVSNFWNGKLMSDPMNYGMKLNTLLEGYKLKYENMSDDSETNSDLNF